ncbi:hypothetical protein M409DRAFT_51018 [Zasmidium cellare ATCC 36951]|uniref:BZIP domain-containing protein n=1 Tax=Zasmidium cellare ATCC 36951 TaxID=1080233 RepID=A0A6A6CZF8_ZASCE|nr:uncharacterized protein M409DRAFT_51018 [Zasmidium cellare ATCC 36951]KAF2170756.1 hypothetical protein M409DRAFT_51018 [Zasmidium cellare ATCC 36951]
MTSPAQTADEKPVVPPLNTQPLSGWHPAQQHQHNPSLGALEQHASHYAHSHAHPAGLPPQLHRGSSDDILSPTSTYRNERVPIEREKRGSLDPSISSPEDSTPGSDQAMVVQQSGPMSTSVTVPSRPRPGRKPIPQEDAADRRRLQNRIAQRNFRDKRQQKLQEALVELEDKKKQYQAEIADMNRRMEESRRSTRELEQRLNAQIQSLVKQAESAEQRALRAEKRNQELEKQLQASKTQQQQLPSIANFRPAQPATTQTGNHMKDLSTPPTSENGMEVDFTNFGRPTGSGYGLHQTMTNDSNQMDYQTGDHCGFCTDLQNCACAQEKAEAAAEKPVPVSLPGSCDQCRADPVRAQACRDMAASTQISARPPTTDDAAMTGVTTTTSMPPPPRRTCASMVDSFNKFGERTSSIASLFGGGRLNTYPAPNGGGYEFEETEAAQVLSNLHRRSTKAESPQSLAESAQEERSPRTL